MGWWDWLTQNRFPWESQGRKPFWEGRTFTFDPLASAGLHGGPSLTVGRKGYEPGGDFNPLPGSAIAGGPASRPAPSRALGAPNPMQNIQSTLKGFQPGGDFAPQLMSLQQFEASVNPAYEAAARRIQDQYRAAFAEIARREASGQKLLGLLPGRIDQQFAEGQGQVSSFAGEAGELPEGFALETPIEDVGFSAAGTAAPFSHALSTLETERHADVPLLEAAQGQYLGAQRSGIEQEQAAALAEIEMRKQQAIAEFLADRQAQEVQMSMQQQELAARAQMPMLEAQAELQAQEQMRQQQLGQLRQMYQDDPGAFGVPRGEVMFHTSSPEFLGRMRQSDNYNMLWDAILQLHKDEGDEGVFQAFFATHGRRYPLTSSLVAYEFKNSMTVPGKGG